MRYLVTITGIVRLEWYQDFMDLINRYPMEGREVEYNPYEFYWTRCSFYVKEEDLWEAESIAYLCMDAEIQVEDLVTAAYLDGLSFFPPE